MSDVVKEALEIKRQVFHAVLGVVFATLYYHGFLGVREMTYVLLTAVVIFFIYKKKEIKIVKFFALHFEREDTKHIGLGGINYLVGVHLTMLLFGGFSKGIVIASILILALGDSTSHVIGTRYGKRKIKVLSEKKLIEGSVAGLLVAGLAASFFVPVLHAFLASTTAMMVEIIEIEKFNIDDNISIPLVSGFVLLILRLYA